MRLKNKGIYIFNTLLVLYILAAIVILVLFLNFKLDFFETYYKYIKFYYHSIIVFILIDIIYMIFDIEPTRKKRLNIFNMISVIVLLVAFSSIVWTYEYYVLAANNML